MNDKKPSQSKTIWFNVLTVGAATLAFVAGQDIIVDYPALSASLGVLVGLVNVALRFVTKGSIK